MHLRHSTMSLLACASVLLKQHAAAKANQTISMLSRLWIFGVYSAMKLSLLGRLLFGWKNESDSI